MNVVILGGVAAGTKTAAKLKRQDPQAHVVIYTKGQDVSYAGCGLPYYVGGSIESRDALVVNTPEHFQGLTGVEVFPGMEAVAVDPAAKTVQLRNVRTQAHSCASYDRLVLAVGAEPFVPNVPGVQLPGVFTLRTPDDAVSLRVFLEANSCRSAVVVGGGFIGLETAENLLARGLHVTVMDMADQLMPEILDPEVADFVRRKLIAKGMRIRTGTTLQGITGEGKAQAVQTNGGTLSADVVVLAMGIRPATGFLAGTGLEMVKGAVVVDRNLRTNLEDIYAVGDCALVSNRITGKQQWSAMGSTANLAGRCLARNLAGEDASYPGCMGTGIVRLAEDLNAGRTGLTEAQARTAGFEVETVTCVSDDKARYYPGSSNFVTKLIADRGSGKLLGAQILGSGTVDKMVDIAVTGIAMGAKLSDFDAMDFSYAPPFSTAIHPFVQACYILQNKISGALESFTPAQYAAGKAKGYRVLDVHPAATLPGATWVDLANIAPALADIPLDEKLLLVCARGRRGYLLQNRMKALGYTNTRVLEGGATLSTVTVQVSASKLDPAEIKRVKGLGCLWDKRYPDVFNVRVITRNGKITTDEHMAIAEAAVKFGSGAVTMTTRLTLEIQGVPYSNIMPLIEFLQAHGLDTGGTGSKVRPVVSCKGTTCQYGLLDSFDLSEKIHERFYVGYHGVVLPHKFKIAVGGCPNNCVKPDLNDLGIVGQRVPLVNLSKCRGCKKCQVEQDCPIHTAKVVDGKIHIDPQECNNCGRCKGRCPFGALEEYQTGYQVYIGGRWGKKVAHGRPLSRLLTSEEEVMDLIERAILFFRDEGITGERFADTITRLGFDYVEDKLLNQAIDKTAILEKAVTGGASC